MATALATVVLMTMAKHNSKRNPGGGRGDNSGSRKGGDGSGNFGSKPNFHRRHHQFRHHRIDAMVNIVRLCWSLV